MQRKYFDFRGLKLAYIEVNPTSPQKILITHANGYAAGMYDYLIEALGAKHHVCALDFSGHGESESTLDFTSWHFFSDQIFALLDHLHWGSATGIGHSLGGGSLIRAAEHDATRFEKLILLDPVILNTLIVTYIKLFGNSMATTARNRRAHFKNKEQALKIFSRHPANRTWQKESVEAYVHYAIRENEGGAELCCNPPLEAKIFSMTEYSHLFRLRQVVCETHFMLPEKSRVCPQGIAQKIIRNNAKSAIHRLPKVGHLLPFENHALVLEHILSLFPPF